MSHIFTVLTLIDQVDPGLEDRFTEENYGGSNIPPEESAVAFRTSGGVLLNSWNAKGLAVGRKGPGKQTEHHPRIMPAFSTHRGILRSDPSGIYRSPTQKMIDFHPKFGI